MSGSLEFRYGMPIRVVSGISEEAQVMSLALRWLIRRQSRRHGCWGKRTELGRIVSTCQTVMTLIAHHHPVEDPTIKRAVAWLKSKATQDSEYGYWSAAPLIAAGDTSDHLVKTIDRIGGLYKQGHQFHPNFIFPLYYHDVLYRSAAGRAAPGLAEVEKAIMERWNRTTCWNDRADSTSWAYCSLENAGSPLIDGTIRSACVDLLKHRAISVGGTNTCWEGSIVATAFVIMNIMSCNLRDDPELRALGQKGTNWLMVKARENRPPHWTEKRENLPAGGEVYDAEYVSAVALRGVLAGQSEPERAVISQVWLADRSRLIAQLKLWKTVVATVGSVAFLSLTGLYLWSAYKAGTLGHLRQIILSILAGIITVADLYGVYRLVRERLDAR